MTNPPLSLSPTKLGISPSSGPSPLTVPNTPSSITLPTPTPTDYNNIVFGEGGNAVKNNSNNYFNVYRYPTDLATAEQPHYVMFYVNVRKSTIPQAEQQSSIANINFDQSSKNKLPSETKGLSAVAGFVGGQAAASQLANTTGLGVVAPVAGLIGGGTGVAYTQSSNDFKNTVQGETTVLLKDVIALYLNGKPSVQYSASWADVDLGLANELGGRFGKAMSDLGGAVGDLSKFDWTALKDKAGNAIGDLFKNSSGIAASLILKSADKANGAFGNFGAALQADAAIVPNPFKAQLFHTMGFRTFTFDYVFLPKNKTEYDHVQAIIKTFKKYMHPTLGADKFIMQYPAEFTIAYYYKGQTNNQLFKMKNCVLTTCKVEYGGTDFTTFKRIPGAPTEISLQIAFVETELLTRADIENNF